MKHFLDSELQALNAKRIRVDEAIVAEFEGPSRLPGRFVRLAGGNSWNSDVEWICPQDEEAFAAFESAFDRLGIAAHAAPYLDTDRGVRLFSGTIIIRSRCTSPFFHADWRKLNNEAFTVITPITANSDAFGLLYKDLKGREAEYRYRVGEAIMFGDNFVHSVKPGRSDEPVMLLSFELGTDKMKHWDAIKAHRPGTPLLKQPDGSFMRTVIAPSRVVA
jgi:hypothetical protein